MDDSHDVCGGDVSALAMKETGGCPKKDEQSEKGMLSAEKKLQNRTLLMPILSSSRNSAVISSVNVIFVEE